jgi:hypothetical protein
MLLDSLRVAGAAEQATALAERAAATSPWATGRCGRLLADRLPGAGLFEIFGKQERATRIDSGSAGRLTAVQRGHGAGKIWTDVARLSST